MISPPGLTRQGLLLAAAFFYFSAGRAQLRESLRLPGGVKKKGGCLERRRARRGDERMP